MVLAAANHRVKEPEHSILRLYNEYQLDSDKCLDIFFERIVPGWLMLSGRCFQVEPAPENLLQDLQDFWVPHREIRKLGALRAKCWQLAGFDYCSDTSR